MTEFSVILSSHLFVDSICLSVNSSKLLLSAVLTAAKATGGVISPFLPEHGYDSEFITFFIYSANLQAVTGW